MAIEDYVAIDLDGVLSEYVGYTAEIGKPTPWAEHLLATLKSMRKKIIIHTARGRYHTLTWLKEHGLDKYVDYINENPELPSDGCKPVAGIYIDDRAVKFDPESIYDELKKFVPYWRAESGQSRTGSG